MRKYNVRHPLVAVKAKGMAIIFVRENAYHNRMPALHPYIRSAANAKSPQRSDRGQKSLVNKEAAYVRLLGPALSNDCTSGPQP